MPTSQYTDFKNVESGQNGTIKGRLPNTEEAGAFAYLKELLFFVPLSWFVNNPYQVIEGTWVIQIKASNEPDATVLFEQTVKWRAGITALVDPFGGIGMTVWQPLENPPGSANPDIRTTRINGQDIDPTTAWTYLDNNLASPLSEFGTTIFDPTANITTSGIYVSAQWRSPYYRTDVPTGAILHRIKDTWQIGTLQPEATYRFSFKAAQPTFGSLYDVPGALRLAYPKNNSTRLLHTYSTPALFQGRVLLKETTSPSIFKDATNRLWLGALRSNEYRLWYSYDDGRTLQAKTYQTGEADDSGFPKTEDVIIWDGSYKYPHTALATGDVIVAVAQRSGSIYFKTSTEDFLHARTVGKAKRSEPYQVLANTQGTLIITNSHDSTFISYDGGLSWAEQS